ncbi:CopD family protein [Halobacterium zhouii]|uniref:CopD family protein n=1 Tax=Halobacterium zhouii TaxID=2902624 RepID=UPI001E4F04B4|nr:CopD family protein [Halobacterium zhouii]
MTSALDLVLVVHTIFAALWTGSTIAVAGAIVPAAQRDLLDADALSLVARRFTYLTLTSVVLLLATGGHLAGTLYTAESLQSTGRGHLVLAMVGLWFALAGILHFATRRLTVDETETVESAAASARPWFLAASGVSLALLVVAGLL